MLSTYEIECMAKEVAAILIKEIAPSEDYMSIRRAAEYLDTSEGAIRQMAYRKKFKSYKLGGRVFVSKKEIDNIITKSYED